MTRTGRIARRQMVVSIREFCPKAACSVEILIYQAVEKLLPPVILNEVKDLKYLERRDSSLRSE